MTFLMEHIVTLLIVTPLLAAALLWTFPIGEHQGARGVALVAMAIEAVWAVLTLTRFFDADVAGLQLSETHDWMPSFGIRYAVALDGLALLMVCLTVLLAPLAVLACWDEIKKQSRDFVACLLLLQGAMIGGFAAVDLFLFYSFWEAMLVPAYFLVGIWGGEHRVRATTRFFLYTMTGSMLMLVAIIAAAWVGHAGGTPSFLYLDVAKNLGQNDLGIIEGLLFAAFVLAFLIKVPIVPLHGWLADTYTEAPSSAVVLLSGVMVKLGAFGLWRYGLLLFPRAATFCMPTLMVLACAGCLYGAWLAAGQSRLRRVVAYSSLSHMGMVILAMTAMTPLALSGAAVQMFNHGVITGALFLLIGMIERRCTSDHFSDLGGLADEAPHLASVFVFVSMAAIGLPGLSGFVGEFMMLLGIYTSEGLGVAMAQGTFAQIGIVLLLAAGTLVVVRTAYLLFALNDGVWQSFVGRLLRIFAGLAVLATVLALVMLPLAGHSGGWIMSVLAPLSVLDEHMLLAAPLAAIFATLSVVLAAVYMLRATERAFYGPPSAHRQPAYDLTTRERWVLAPLLLLILGLGFYPAPLLRLAEPSMTQMTRYFRVGAGWPPSAEPLQTIGALQPQSAVVTTVEDLP